MSTDILGLARKFSGFFPKSKRDPRTAEQAVKDRPIYYLGEGRTPTEAQIVQACARQTARRQRPETLWRRLDGGPDFDTARAAMVCASDYSSSDNDLNQRRRTIRHLAFDSRAEIFIRNLHVSPDRFLIELRHPSLSVNASRPPLGIRFLGLSRDAWRTKDFVGLLLDGRAEHFRRVFTPDFAHTLDDPDLAEIYLRFALDHIEFKDDEQIYVVADRDDFVLEPPPQPAIAGQPDAFLTSQFRVSQLPPVAAVPATAAEPDTPAAVTAPADFPAPAEPAAPAAAVEPDPDPLLSALKVPQDAIIPPTCLENVAATPSSLAHVIVFATVIYGGRLFHTCFAVYSDGQITQIGDALAHTAEDQRLPVSPIRSFAEQRATLKAEAAP